MTLVLHIHPLSSYCHKVLIGLYERGTPFVARSVDFADAEARAAFARLWPTAKIPLLVDEARGVTVPESTIMLEYVEQHDPAPMSLFPKAPEAALSARLWDRLFDAYVMTPMQKIVGDRLRPEDQRDPFGVAEARRTLHMAYGMADAHLATRTWAAGDAFSIAECAATPALFYAGIIEPFADRCPHLAAYFERLLARPSVQRVLKEAQPFFPYFPYREAMPARFLQASG
jgi:glutathione S-transferase